MCRQINKQYLRQKKLNHGNNLNIKYIYKTKTSSTDLPVRLLYRLTVVLCTYFILQLLPLWKVNFLFIITTLKSFISLYSDWKLCISIMSAILKTVVSRITCIVSITPETVALGALMRCDRLHYVTWWYVSNFDIRLIFLPTFASEVLLLHTVFREKEGSEMYFKAKNIHLT